MSLMRYVILTSSTVPDFDIPIVYFLQAIVAALEPPVVRGSKKKCRIL
jgi:hypothetical protein